MAGKSETWTYVDGEWHEGEDEDRPERQERRLASRIEAPGDRGRQRRCESRLEILQHESRDLLVVPAPVLLVDGVGDELVSPCLVRGQARLDGLQRGA